MMSGYAHTAPLRQLYQQREYAPPYHMLPILHSFEESTEQQLRGLHYEDRSNSSSVDETSKQSNYNGLTIKKKLPIKKRASMGAAVRADAVHSLDSDIYNNSRLDAFSTTLSVSSSDLESSQSNAADSQSLLQPAQVQRLQPIRTVSGMHATAAAAQVRLDERGTQACPDMSSLSGQNAHHDTGFATQPFMHQPADDDISPTKLAIRRGPQWSGMQNPSTSALMHIFQGHTHQALFQTQQHAPSPIMEEPYELSDVGQSIRRARQQEASSFDHTTLCTGYHHSVAAASSTLPETSITPGYKRGFDNHGLELGDDIEGSCMDMPTQFHYNEMPQHTTHTPASPRSVTCSGSPQKLAIRRVHQDSGYTAGVRLHNSPDQNGFMSPRYTQAGRTMTHSQHHIDPDAIFAQRDAEYMHAYQAEYLWQQQQQQQHRRASMGACMHYSNASDCYGVSTGVGLHCNALQTHQQPQRSTARTADRCPGSPDKSKLPTAEELNLPGWL